MLMKTRILLLNLILFFCGGIFADGIRETVLLTQAWDAQTAAGIEDPPKSHLWGSSAKPEQGIRRIVQPEQAGGKGNPKSKSAWFRQFPEIPAEWKGRTVLFSVPLVQGDLVVFLNGKKAGEILRPTGTLNLSDKLEYGRKNELLLFLTGNGSGISRKNPVYQDTDWRVVNTIGFYPPQLGVLPNTYIDDVFANTSAEKKQLSLEMEVVSSQSGDGLLKAEIFDREGNVVKRAEKELRFLPGINPVKVRIPWENPHYWELGRGYLYTCRVVLTDRSASVKDEYPSFRFGFRQFTTRGRELILNNHIQRLRTVYSFGAGPGGASFLKMIGYNTLIYSHCTQTFPWIPGEQAEKELCEMDEMGIGLIKPAPSVGLLRDRIRKDPAAAVEFERCMKLFMKRYRNHPSIIGWYVGNITNYGSPEPTQFAQFFDRGPQAQNIEKAIQIGKKYNPNTFFYSFADGNTGDLHNSFLYLNFTPIQEREEWLSSWSKHGVAPWQASEFGEPYRGNYWQGRIFLFTEYMAIFFGDQAYREEPEKGLENIIRMSLANKSSHGGNVPGFNMYEEYPLFWKFRREITWRTNRSWRTYGLNGGVMYFNLDEAYGNPPNGRGYGRYGAIKTRITKKPEWANAAFAIHQLGNLDFVGYIGGYPEHTDKTHAYYSGEKITKQAVFIWDGFGKKTCSANWRAICNGKTVASGHFQESMEIGDIRLKKLEFQAPVVRKKTNGHIEIVYRSGKEELFRDRLDFEVYPPMIPQHRKRREPVALLDPEGSAAPILNALNIPFRKVQNCGEAEQANVLVIGKNALSNTEMDLKAEQIATGKRVLILPQKPEFWKSLGFKVMDPMARQVFLRDRKNPFFANLSDDMLRNWRGAPDYGAPYGRIMNHDTQRGPRWTRNMTVAGLMLQIPERTGFQPLIDGEFDMNYAALLRWRTGNGAVTFCTLDFENRVPSDPAATYTASSVFEEFLHAPLSGRRSAAFEGKLAEEILKRTGTLVTSGNSPLIVVDKDSRLSWEMIRHKADQGADILVVCGDHLLREAGFQLEKKRIRRATPSDFPLFTGIGHSLLRWRDFVEVNLIRSAPRNFRIELDGLAACGKSGKGNIVFFQLDPFQIQNRYARKKEIRDATALSTERMIQLYARLLTNLGAECETNLSRRILLPKEMDSYEALKYFYVLGPFEVARDDSKLMLDTVFPGESMAIRGDFNPNPVFALPQGGTANWRTTVSADQNGFVDLKPLFPNSSLSVSYLICHFERKNAGRAILKLGFDWRARIWCNGQEVFRTERGAKDFRFSVELPLKKGDNFLTIKLGSGSVGNSFRAKISTERKKENHERQFPPELNEVCFYDELIQGFDPYRYIYW